LLPDFIFKDIMHQIQFRRGSAPYPARSRTL